jgi:hypothetical protein
MFKRGVKIRQGVLVSPYGVSCGICTYTSYLLEASNHQIRILSESPDGKYNNHSDVIGVIDPKNVSYEALKNAVANVNGSPVFWFQHEFGINPTPEFLKTIKYLQLLGAKVYVTPHSIHFESNTVSGMKKDQEEFLEQILPFVDKVVVLSDGVYKAGVRKFPQYEDKFSEIRHGVHDYSHLPPKQEIRQELFDFLEDHIIDPKIKRKLDLMQRHLKNNSALCIGSSGMINRAKTSYLAGLRASVEKRIQIPVYALYMGGLHPNAVKSKDEGAYKTLHMLKEAAEHDPRFIFIDMYVPERLFPYVLGTPDVVCAYEEGNTQSGRTCHLLGIPNTLALVGDFEGNGETLRMIGIPLARGREDLDTITKRLLLMDPQKRGEIERNRKEYLRKFSWHRQALKHVGLINVPDSQDTDISSSQRFKRPLETIVLGERRIVVG